MIRAVTLGLMLYLNGCTLALAQPPSGIESADGYENVADRLRIVIRHEMASKNVPAFSIALIDAEQIVWSEGFGVADSNGRTPATARTGYRVGSISKLFTDVAVMQLVEQDILALDEPIAKYIPEFKPRNPFGTPITLRRLMSHRSGLVRESPVGNYFDPSEPSLRSTVDSLNQTSLVYRPESKTKYSNAGIAVVGYALERVQGIPFSALIDQSVLKPLGMHDSGFVLTPSIERRLATAWMWTYDGRRFEAPRFALGTAPAGNLYSNVLDLSKFVVAIFNNGRAVGGQLLRPETLQLMMSPQATETDDERRFGIGFHISEIDGNRRVGHGGAVYGFSTQLEALPDRKLGVVATSSLDGSNGTIRRIVDHALRLMLARQDGKALPDLKLTSPVPLGRASQMVGTYADGNDSVDISLRDGRLFMRRGSFRLELRSLADGLIVDDVFGFGPEISRPDIDSLTVGGQRYLRSGDEKPDAIPDRWMGLIGEYGWGHNTLYILEDRGRLFALIEWFYYYPLEEIGENHYAFPDYGLYHGENLYFTRDARGRATKVVAAEVTFNRRESGPPQGETFRIRPAKPIEQLREDASRAKPPEESGPFRSPDLVELTELAPSIRLDIRYATTNNFMGAVFYQQARAFMQRPAAEAVVRAHNRLKVHGLGLLIHDAYRPWYVTKMFWDATPEKLKDFVADPSRGSRHNRGCAVDLTLCDLMTGEPVPMVAGYDEFSTRSYPAYPGGTSRERWHRELLRRTMEAEGFTIYQYEWWHFDYKDWKEYPILNITFEDISPAR